MVHDLWEPFPRQGCGCARRDTAGTLISIDEASVRKLTGETGGAALRRNVVAARAISRKAGGCELRPEIYTGFDLQGREVATFEAETYSAHVRSLPDADGLIYLPTEAEALPAGAFVEFQPF
ncbi:hypothetical protein [Thalassovita sp.]|uniref:hypothetical protein n=1 Tax=Thalassovita sp. TaxID=1979401 RepID=UPI002B26E841|nr:hypothetical protein [Thalassovita sp.]